MKSFLKALLKPVTLIIQYSIQGFRSEVQSQLQSISSQSAELKSLLEKNSTELLAGREENNKLSRQLAQMELALGLRPIKVALFVQLPQIWQWAQGLYECLNKDPRFSVTLVQQPFYHASYKSPEELNTLLQKAGVSFLSWEQCNLETMELDLVILTTPYDDTRPPEFSLKSIQSVVKRVAYIPYGLEIGGGSENQRYQFNLPVHQEAWRVFARSPSHSAMFSKYCDTGNANVVVTGHPKFDRLVKELKISNTSELSRAKKDRFAVLWNPHFSVEKGLEYSTFVKWKDLLLKEFKKRPDLYLILRPHPLLFSQVVQSGQLAQNEVDEFKLLIQKSDNMTLDESSDPVDAFVASDCMISDASSFLLEYLVTEKPILYLINSDGPGLNDDGNIADYYYVASDAPDIIKFLDMVGQEEDPLKKSRISQINEFIYKPDGHTSERILNHIASAFGSLDSPQIKNNTDKAADIKSPSTDNLHINSQKYWKEADDTFLAPPEYYEKQELILNKEVCPLLDKEQRVLDVGCGNGRFSYLFAKHCKTVLGIDLSDQLIKAAKEGAKSLQLDNIEFACIDTTEGEPKEQYEIVSCMGVTSTVIDEDIFAALLQKLKAWLRPGGTLILKESVSKNGDEIYQDPKTGYTSAYRDYARYKEAFSDLGLNFIKEVHLAEFSGKVNNLFILELAGSEKTSV
ncbi:methyltransferase domain-containing protein [Gammaproteobacteria bacterium]|nr:methyltransferase domain-containing protein [Gammaproteobacteria bacterium]